PSASATVSFCLPTAEFAELDHLISFAAGAGRYQPVWRTCFLRSPEIAASYYAPVRALLGKELREVLSGRALWTMLLILCSIVGFSFFQAVALYGEASSAARDSPTLASGLSPLDGVLVPSFGALYICVTLLFPFVAIRTLGREKESGALRLLVQLPYRTPTL